MKQHSHAKPGTKAESMDDHRAYVGPPEYYDVIGGLQFVVLMALGLRQSHTVLDVGCGSLRGGRFIMQYLDQGHYYGVEPNSWLIEAAIAHEIGQNMIGLKRPHFSSDDKLDLSAWNRQFDFILAQSIITHAPRDMVAKLMREAAAALEPDGIFVATYLVGERDNTLEEWSYPEGVFWTQETVFGLARQAGLSSNQLVFPHPAGQVWIMMAHE